MHDPESSFGLAQLCDTEALPRAGYSGLHGVRDLSNIVAHCYNEPTLKTLYVFVKWQGMTGSATLAISSCILKEVQREQIPHSTYWLTVKLVLLLLSAAGFNLSKYQGMSHACPLSASASILSIIAILMLWRAHTTAHLPCTGGLFAFTTAQTSVVHLECQFPVCGLHHTGLQLCAAC